MKTVIPVQVKLQWYEEEIAKFHAQRKEEVSTQENMNHKYGWNPSTEESLATGIQSVGAEIAVAKLLDRYWIPGNKTFKGADVSHDIQVRWTRTKSLIVRPPDSDDEWFYMVTGYMPNYEVWGYILGEDAKREEWFRDPRNRNSPAYFVPREELMPVDARELVA